jgi:flavorubredoxin
VTRDRAMGRGAGRGHPATVRSIRKETQMDTPFSPLDSVIALPSSLPAPGGVLPVHAYLLRGSAPVLIDAGMAVDALAFLDALDSVVDLSALAAVVITHEDADHTGALAELLARAPAAKVVTSGIGVGKMSAALALPDDRLQVVAPGDRLALGGRRFRVVAPPLYDSPATVMLFEEDAGLLFSSDAFGAFVADNAEHLEALDAEAALAGMRAFCRANSPWLAHVDRAAFARALDALAALDAQWLLASHLPPARAPLAARVLEEAASLAG